MKYICTNKKLWDFYKESTNSLSLVYWWHDYVLKEYASHEHLLGEKLKRIINTHTSVQRQRASAYMDEGNVPTTIHLTYRPVLTGWLELTTRKNIKKNNEPQSVFMWEYNIREIQKKCVKHIHIAATREEQETWVSTRFIQKPT